MLFSHSVNTVFHMLGFISGKRGQGEAKESFSKVFRILL